MNHVIGYCNFTRKIEMTESDLDSLISSTLTAIDATKTAKESSKDIPKLSDSNGCPSSESLADEVDECLNKLGAAAPKVQAGPEASDDALGQLLDNLLTPDTVLDSMQALAVEMDKFLATGPSLTIDELNKCKRQSEIYNEVAKIYETSPGINEDDTSEESVRLRALLTELQDLGQPPKEVIESLMMSQLSEDGDADSSEFVREFQQFMSQAASGSSSGSPNIPGLTKEDEDILKQLTSDPNAMKDLLSNMGNKDGDCCIS
jgi:hypothetical protein